jgi:uncharacterized membrane protein (UPF0127 family)
MAGGANAQMQKVNLTVGGHSILAEVAADEHTQHLGLMYRSSLPPDQGMVFVHPLPGLLCMWMKNTLIPLSVAFLDEKGRVINIEDMAPQTEESHCSASAARFALEMNRGWFAKHKIKAGDRIEGVEALAKEIP